MGWAETSRAAIMRVHMALPDGGTPAERKRALRDAYPFGSRTGWAYKAWLREQKKYLARFPDVSKLKESPLFRASRGLSPEKPKRKAMMRYRDSGWNVDGRFAVFGCARCGTERTIQIASDADKLAKHPCEKCNGAQR